MRKEKSLLKRAAPPFLAGLLVALMPAPSYAADIYFIYSGKDKSLMNEMSQQVPASLTIKIYNIDLLALADYSGKQKVTAKLKRADFIFFVNEKARAPFDSSFDNDATAFIVRTPENIEEIFGGISFQ